MATEQLDTTDGPPGIPFSFFVSLLREISQIQPQKTTTVSSVTNESYPALEIFRRWIVQLRVNFSPLPPGSTSIIFRLLFPEEDVFRKYDMQETKLSQHLAECLGISVRHLEQWCCETSSGCLGKELKMTLENICPNNEHASTLSISQVDQLLDELASNSGFSDVSIRTKYPRGVRRGRLPLIRTLFRPLSPVDASFLTHVILKDLRPVLYPLQETHYTSALTSYNTTSIQMLTKEHAMRAWDPTCCMLGTYLVRSTIDAATTCFELSPHQRQPIVPCIGIPVEIPKSLKGRNCHHALSFFRNSRKVWAETKYDGERAQIHVEVLPNIKPRITIFSKSKRNSTMDRHAIHGPILETLNLANSEGYEPKLKRNIILDAEMVACHGTNIDEFWRIRHLIEHSAYGIRHNYNDSDSKGPSSLYTRPCVWDDSHHLGLVFFDVLLLDSVSLLSIPYAQRREILQSTVRPIAGKSMFSERVPIFLHCQDETQASSTLEKIFQDVVSNRQEGIVLKADEASYHDFRTQWVKLKQDYIPGYGDALDLAVLGAGWDKTRARELRVPPTTLTTLYIGALTNPDTMSAKTESRPHFHIYFTVSYGLSRERLEEVNFLLKNSDTVPYHASMPTESLPYEFTLLGTLHPPSMFLVTPLLAELFGAGFTKSPESTNYELRFPRVTKLYRAKERSWKDGVDLLALQKIARDAVIPDRSDEEVREWCNDLWGQQASPMIKSSPGLKRRVTSDTRSASNTGNQSSNVEKFLPSEPKRARISNTQPFVISKPPVLAARTNVDDRSPDPTVQFQGSLPTLAQKSITCGNNGPRVIDPPSHKSNFDHLVPSMLSAKRTLTMIGQPILELPAPGMAFIEHALIWFAKPPGSTNWSWTKLVPRQQRIHSIESLLTGCGWHTDRDGPVSTWVKRGVIFVDEGDEMGKKWKSYATKVIEERRGRLTATEPSERSQWKPICMFDIRAQTLHWHKYIGRSREL